jgi:hypothetical protein
MILKLILITVVLMAAAFALIGIKMFFIKDAVFTKTCSSDLESSDGKKMDCMCEKNPDYVCENYELHHGKLKDS